MKSIMELDSTQQGKLNFSSGVREEDYLEEVNLDLKDGFKLGGGRRKAIVVRNNSVWLSILAGRV